jgi:hypothetical protein
MFESVLHNDHDRNIMSSVVESCCDSRNEPSGVLHVYGYYPYYLSVTSYGDRLLE